MSEITYLEAIQEGIKQVLEKDEDTFLIGEDIGLYGGSFALTRGLFDIFGEERIKDTPISENGLIGTALGAAMTGMRPIAELMFSDFSTCAMDQIVNQAAKVRYQFGGKAKVPLTIRAAHGGGLGFAAQHSQSLEGLFAAVPGLKIVMPSCPYDAKGLFVSSVYDNNPVIFLEHKVLYKNKHYIQEVPNELYEIPLGKGEIKKEGKDLTIVATSYMVQKSLEVAKELKEKMQIDIEVVDPRTIKPLDTEIIFESVKKTGKVICVEEGCSFGGFMGEVAAQIAETCFDYLDAPVTRVASKNCPVPYSAILEAEMIPSHDKIKASVLNLLDVKE